MSAQIKSELDEVQAEIGCSNREALQEELSDVLHAWVTLVDFCGFDPQETIQLAAKKFEKRLIALKAVIQEEGLDDFKNLPRSEKLLVWDKAKQKIKAQAD